ncbi:hypothetical protein ANN_19451 [Periplaneta americana]|uniref:Uncharacterized protein n=1 Tax=Periplaneta americana TaxID=6978 RepID=A0ABQ8SAU1_PERAM|nr:hypothetical protein ANN_19451 [Periplaneta americana]
MQMAGLCEGGNEPPGSLKASNDKEKNECEMRRKELFLEDLPRSNIPLRQLRWVSVSYPLLGEQAIALSQEVKEKEDDDDDDDCYN